VRNALGLDALSDLPKRVRDIVDKEDRASEHLIGWTQLAIGCILLSLYLIAPRPADAPMSMQAPVPLALSAYISFSLLRIWLISRHKTPDWFVALSIIADISIVIALIWTFHIEYRQPPGFALKAPTFVYLLVLIVLRALRFEPRYVLAAGLSGALGWGLLTLVAVSLSEAGTITRSYSEYINGNRILIGAEFDKIFAILMITCLLAVGARRAQRTLVAAVREEAAAREIGRFLSKGVADQIAQSEEIIEAGQAAERQAAIMMIDIRGFTPFAMSVSPQKVVQILTALHSRIIPIVRANHGVVDKFLGDGVMATFGATAPHPTSAANAMRALDQVLETAADWQASLPSQGVLTPLRINAAVAAGNVVFATLGAGDRLEYTVIGEAVNLAAKLEKHNKSEKSIAAVPANVFARAIDDGYQPAGFFELRRDRNVQGVSEPMDLFVRNE
jgi:adenylate cyclase